MADPRNTVDRELAVLRKAYTARIQEQIGKIDGIWHAAQKGGWDGEALATLRALAHSIAGSGATFGYPTLSQAAAPLEDLVDDVLGVEAPPSDAQRDRLAQLIEILRCACSGLPSAGAPSRQGATRPTKV